MVKFLVQCIVVVCVFLLVSAYQEKDMLSEDGTQPAPYFSLASLTGDKRIDLVSLQGQKTIVYFFAPWCHVCKLSMPNLNNIYEQQNINVVAIALDYDDAAQVQHFIDELELSMPVLLGHHNIKANYRVSAYPSYYVLDEKSNIIARSRGYSSELGLRMRM
ncbi:MULTISPECIES: TlpA family protein disulfide reductase [Pseudoalteromonas]|uniref:Heme-binding protein n=1 Tax=Pseudoalteromonas amylolytica TaxID=1859457 RepID=A0A1S1MLQ5_9GAMM|nr:MULTISPECIES: TlpA disulfide reductase family protein [Pseudoalteromonas]MCF6436302.1 TlpA family protein disulfide reductase [Pseudoalteromonas sp. MMG022]OHU86773.1 heme-binding protein [Pseudoalteromonas sp. JW3]OHU88702.1 heme-binding protein [Pseudoalteromonas amylolytica]